MSNKQLAIGAGVFVCVAVFLYLTFMPTQAVVGRFTLSAFAFLVVFSIAAAIRDRYL